MGNALHRDWRRKLLAPKKGAAGSGVRWLTPATGAGRPVRHIAIAFVVVVAIMAAFASSASANYLATRQYSGGVTKQGVRASITAPVSGNVTETSPDALGSMVYAIDGNAQYGMNIGLLRVDNMPTSYDCYFGSGEYRINFVEAVSGGQYTCFNEGAWSWGGNSLYTVDEGTDHYWRAYLNGGYLNVRTQWNSTCGYDACSVSAQGESVVGTSPGLWEAYFSGSGLSPWAVWNGSNWSTIGTSGINDSKDTGWTGPFGSYPTGQWFFQYSN